MALISTADAAKKKATALPTGIEETINSNLGQGIRSWEMDSDWEFYEDDIIDNAEEAGWLCKIVKKVAPHDPEVNMKFIKFAPKQ